MRFYSYRVFKFLKGNFTIVNFMEKVKKEKEWKVIFVLPP